MITFERTVCLPAVWTMININQCRFTFLNSNTATKHANKPYITVSKYKLNYAFDHEHIYSISFPFTSSIYQSVCQ